MAPRIVRGFVPSHATSSSVSSQLSAKADLPLKALLSRADRAQCPSLWIGSIKCSQSYCSHPYCKPANAAFSWCLRPRDNSVVARRADSSGKWQFATYRITWMYEEHVAAQSCYNADSWDLCGRVLQIARGWRMAVEWQGYLRGDADSLFQGSKDCWFAGVAKSKAPKGEAL